MPVVIKSRGVKFRPRRRLLGAQEEFLVTLATTFISHDPSGARRYFGGPSEVNATVMVFRESHTPAISETGKHSDPRNRRISAQFYSFNTRHLPGPKQRFSDTTFAVEAVVTAYCEQLS